MAKNIEELEDDAPVQEIIGKTPNWLILYGNYLICIFFILFILILILIQYPDKIESDIKITSMNSPKSIISITQGRITKLLKKNGEFVAADSIIGYVESIGQHDDIIMISHTMDSLRLFITNTENIDSIKAINLSMKVRLGELQNSYSVFLESVEDFNDYLPSGRYSLKEKNIIHEINKIYEVNKYLNNQYKILQDDLENAKKDLEMTEKLNKSGVISDYDYRIAKNTFNKSLLALPELNVEIETNNQLLSQRSNDLDEIKNSQKKIKRQFLNKINVFISEINQWKKEYLLIAPISGNLFFSSFVQENSQINIDQDLGYIDPLNSMYYGEMLIKETNIGKVQIGQKVMIKLEAYPYTQFGFLEGQLEYVSPINTEGFLAKVSINSDLITTYKKNIYYRSGLTGTCEIITTKLSLLERFYYSIISINY